ncbi:MAG: cytochrome c [Hyphomicrobiaceae bacterium]|nr:cytochrome c [Hyphomicrobiaceae bacterium]MCC0024000.1 cytochrome c [Hyphomicrobiaceae bacterium]
MKQALSTLLLIVPFFMAPALAQDAPQGQPDPSHEAVLARGKVMTDMGKALRTLQLGLRQKDDIGSLLLAAELVNMNAELITNVFQTEAYEPGSEALPAIWQNWEDFSNKAEAALEQTAALVDAIDMEDLREANSLLRKVTADCAACHDVYRGESDR